MISNANLACVFLPNINAILNQTVMMQVMKSNAVRKRVTHFWNSDAILAVVSQLYGPVTDRWTAVMLLMNLLNVVSSFEFFLKN